MNLKNKKIILFVVAVIIVILIVIMFFLLNNNDEDIVVNYDEVETLYDDLEKIECTENCGEREYVSKLYGYSYDSDGNVKMDVMEGYTENNKVYNLDGQEIGDYSKDALNDVLDKGTLKTYNYERVSDNYKLINE